MKKYIQYLFSVLVTLNICFLSIGHVAAAADTAPVPPLFISELQTSGGSPTVEDGRQEFVELYNPSPEPLMVAGWQLQYMSAANDGSGAATRTLITLSGTIAGRTFLLVSSQGYLLNADLYYAHADNSPSGSLARSGGHVRVVDSSGLSVDVVGWGTGVPITPWWKSAEVPAGKSIERYLPNEVGYTSSLSYRPPSIPTPYSGSYAGSPNVANILPEDPAEVCSGLVLSEILPNPAGADVGQEYIEVHNPSTISVRLKGCFLGLSTAVSFALPDELLAPGGYRTFYDDESLLNLPNSAAVPVALRTATESQTVLYPDGMADGQAWAQITGTWQLTRLPTPGEANILSSASSPSAVLGGAEVAGSLTPCSEGKERNVVTNRCRTIVPSDEAAAACKAGQERNPATNRCRAISVATSQGLVPCQVGQIRNPDTNRCRAVQSTETTAKPCPEGQERNPQTNRCRKSAAAGIKNFATVKDIQAGSLTSNYRWWIAGIVVACAIGYAAYEWRHDITNATHAFRQRWRTSRRKS